MQYECINCTNEAGIDGMCQVCRAELGEEHFLTPVRAESPTKDLSSVGLMGADGLYICTMYFHKHTPKAQNLAHIVRVLNVHAELVSALSRIMHYASTGASVCDVDTSAQPEFVAARAALAKAQA